MIGGTMATHGRKSELEAVNAILAVTGDSPITDLEDTYEQAQLALQVLHRESRNIQMEGFYFNKEENIELKNITTGEVMLPLDAISVTPVDNRYIERGNRLYDKEDRTFLIKKPVTVNIITLLQWDDLPELARQAILTQAMVSFNSNFNGDDSIKQSLERDAMLALINLRVENTRNQQRNMLNNSKIHNIAFRNRRGRF